MVAGVNMKGVIQTVPETVSSAAMALTAIFKVVHNLAHAGEIASEVAIVHAEAFKADSEQAVLANSMERLLGYEERIEAAKAAKNRKAQNNME